MGNPLMVHVAAGTSVVLGILTLAASSLFLDDWRKPYDRYSCDTYIGDGPGDECKMMQYFIIGAALGLIAGVMQILSSVLGFAKKGKAWALIHQMVVVFLLVTAFTIPLSERAQDIRDAYLGGSDVSRWRALVFIAVTGVDAVVTLALVPAAIHYS